MLLTFPGAIIWLMLGTVSYGYYFEHGYDHFYTYSAKSDLLGLHDVTTVMKFRVRPINQTDQGTTLHRLYLDSFVQHSQHGYMMENPMKWNLSKSFLFHVDKDGLVSAVHYPAVDDREVVSLKKVLSSVLSAKKTGGESGTTFKSREIDHAGDLHHTYHVSRKSDGLVVKRLHQSSEEVKRLHNKTLHYDRKGTIHFVSAEDRIVMHNDTKVVQNRASLPGEARIDDSSSGEFPTISTSSLSHIKLTLKRKHEDVSIHGTDEDMIEDILLIKKPIPEKKRLEEVNDTLASLMQCIRSQSNKFDTRRTDCVKNLRETLESLQDIDYLSIAEEALNSTCPENDTICTDHRQLFIDLVAGKGDDQSQVLILKHFLQNENADEEDVHRCLFHCVALENPEKDLIAAIEKMCFGHEDSLFGSEKLGKTQRRACLTLSALCKTIHKSQGDTSERIVEKLERWLGHHDEERSSKIIQARKKRSVTEVDHVRKNHVVTKMVLIHALGNAGLNRSIDHILSYMKPNQGVMAWRRAAIHGLRHYSCNRVTRPVRHVEQELLTLPEHLMSSSVFSESASSLLYISVHDDTDVVRDEAYEAFNNHPKGKYLTEEHKNMLASKRYIYPVLMRLKRGIFEADTRDGIHFAIKLPGIAWSKTIGSDAVGASFGLQVKNQLELELQPLQGHFLIDVLDEAFAEAHVGLLHLEVDIFRVHLCYRGHIEYDLNVLKDFGINNIQDMAHVFDKIFKTFIDPVKDAVELFEDVINTFKNGGVERLFNGLVDVIKHLPQILKDMADKFIKFVVKVVKSGKLPWIEKAKSIIIKVKTLAEEVQDDIMGFYHSIVDAVTVQIPFIGKKLKEAIVTILSSVRNLITHPMQAFTSLAKSLLDVKLSISMFIDVKNKILEVCSFLTGKSPLWQHLGEEVGVIVDEVKDLKEMLVSVFRPHKFSSQFNSSLSDGISSVEEQTVSVIHMFRAEIEDIFSPLDKLMKAAEPFVHIFHEIMDLVHKIKSAFELVRSVINTGKSMVHKIFGPKFSIKFPTHRRETIEPCGQGIWPTTSGDTYKTTGVDLVIKEGSSVVCPVNALVSRKEENRVFIEPTDDEFAQYEIIIDNVKPDGNISNTDANYVEAGKTIGKAQRSKCQPNFIHVAMRKKTYSTIKDEDGDYVDPGPYLDRIVPIPHWTQECNDHYFVHLNAVIDSGELDENGAKDQFESIKRNLGKKKDEFAKIKPKAKQPYRWKGMKNAGKSIRRSLKKGMKKALSAFRNVGNIFKGGKLPNIRDIIDINKFNLTKILGMLTSPTSCKVSLSDLVKKLKKKLTEIPNVHLESLSISELISMTPLKKFKDKFHMIANRLQQAEDRCKIFEGTIAKGQGHICTSQKDCKGLNCSISLEHGTDTHLVYLGIRVDTCNKKVYITNVDTQEINLDGRKHFMHIGNVGLDNMDVTLIIDGDVEDGKLLVSIDASLCISEFLSCLPDVNVLSDTPFPMSRDCQDKPEDSESGGIGDMTLAEFLQHLSSFNMLGQDVLCLVNSIRDTMVTKLLEDPRQLLSLIGEGFPDKKDTCVNADITVPTKTIKFFEKTYVFMVGPVPLDLRFGAGGAIGVSMSLNACLLSLSATSTVTPKVAGKVWGVLEVNIGFARGGIKLVGYLLETKFPITGMLDFSKCPLDVTAKMDMELTPVRLKLKAFAELNLLFTHVKVFDASIWKYKAPMISKNVFTKIRKGEDKSPPSIMPSTRNSRRKREGPRGCQLKQLKGRNPSDTAFMLEMAVEDEVSQVKLFYAIGTQRGGTNVQGWTEMGGSSLLVPTSSLQNKIPLYWTVKAGNSQGLFAYTHCMLNTYDNSVPDGRIDPSYTSSSHPSKLSGTIVAFDDSPLVDTHKVALGLSPGQYGSEVSNWETLSLQNTQARMDESSDLRFFSVPREGKLAAESFHQTKTDTPLLCAKECLKYRAKCVSFNYEYHSETCDLNQVVEGPDAKLRISGTYKYFERLGIGHSTFIEYDKLDLKHATIYYVNADITNVLGYKAYITSTGTMVDFTPPETGPLGENYTETFRADGCNASYRQKERCIEVTSQKNHRIIRDGKNAKTVFNGHKPLEDTLYTLSNHYISMNFDGFKDNETGIWGYSWAVGKQICGTDVVDFNDPHALLSSRKFWTFTGYDKSVTLPDGKYYTTVQALNNIVYGGALVTTVCHTTPLTVDTTPPVFGGVTEIMFDEDFDILGVYFNGYDDLSQISRVDFGLGETKYDVMVKGYSTIPFKATNSPYFVVDDLDLEPGVPAWIRVRLANNVELFTAGHGDEPIMIDKTAPVIGKVLDGDTLKRDAKYQSDDSQICAQWIEFYDPESGIQEFIWGVGLKPGLDDIVPFHKFTHSQKQSCSDVPLQHNVRYFSTVVALNDALNSKSSNTSSDGVLIDITNPVPGSVNDGNNVTEDIEFSSESATKWCNWKNFTDTESYIDRYEVSVYINTDKIKTFEVGNVTSFTDHSVPMKHLDEVNFEVIAIDGAGLPVQVTSNGFKIDHTAPIMRYIKDTDAGGKYQANTSVLSLHWDFFDSESGVKEYRYFINEIAQGMKHKIWPKNSEHETMALSSLFLTQADINVGDLVLMNGGKYSVHVTAFNQALMSTTHESEGVIVDNTPPSIKKVIIALPLEEEELDDDGFVLHADPNHMDVTWQGRDAESDIKNIFVGIGLSPGDTNETRGFLTFGNERSVVIKNLNLDISEDTSKVFYVTLKAENGAGLISDPISSKPIKILRANVPGVLFDGRDRFIDEDYAVDKTSIGLTFSGFESEACNIVGYEWAIGSSPYMSDVMPFTDYGIVLLNSSHGQAQIHIQLYEGSTYYTTVRARTGHNCHEEYIVSSSDGIKIDSRNPNIIHIEPLKGDNNYKESRGSFFQNFDDSIKLSFNVTDNSPIRETSWSVGSLPMIDDIRKWTGKSIASLSTEHLTLQPGSSVFLNVRAEDDAGNKNSAYSKSIVPDLTSPVINGFSCTKFISIIKSSVTCKWRSIDEFESIIDQIFIDLGTREEGNDVASGMEVSKHRSSWTRDIHENLKLNAKTEKIFVTLHAINILGQEKTSHFEIIVDRSPPSSGTVQFVTRTDNKGITELQRCQIPWTYVEIMISNITDADSEIDRVEVSLGTRPQQSDIRDFMVVDISRKIFIGHLLLKPSSQVHATARAYNKAGLYALFFSQPIAISPYPNLSVYDGSDPVVDTEFQTDLNAIYGHWHYSDPCPIQKVEWSVNDLIGTVVKDFARIPENGHYFYNDELHLENGKIYFVTVRTWDSLGRMLESTSNGVTVRIQPPNLANVRDGLDDDINYQESTTQLSANWEQFGDPKSTDPVQIIKHYEVAIGNDRRYSLTRTNVHYFENVGLNTSHTFYNLNLTAISEQYFITVRAYSEAGSYEQGYSNGIKVGFSDDVIPGVIEVNFFQSKTDSISVSWSDFESDIGIKKYKVGLGSQPFDIANNTFTCTELSNYDHEFDVIAPVDVGLNTLYTLTNLTLIHGERYYPIVIAVSESDMCAVAVSHPIIVDLTPPLSNDVKIVLNDKRRLNQSLIYVTDTEKLKVDWTEIPDPESGLQYVTASLLSIDGCPAVNHAITAESLVSEIKIMNESKATFYDIFLSSGQYYVVRLTAVNNAGLSQQIRSSIFLIDSTPPFPGVVRIGPSWNTSTSFQSSTDTIKAWTAIAKTEVAYVCESQLDLLQDKDLWRPLGDPFDTTMTGKLGSEGVEVKIGINRRLKLVKGGLYTIKETRLRKGNYTVYLKAAKGKKIITTFSAASRIDIMPDTFKPPASQSFDSVESNHTWTELSDDENNSTSTTIQEFSSSTTENTTSHPVTFFKQTQRPSQSNDSDGYSVLRDDSDGGFGFHILGEKQSNSKYWDGMFWAVDKYKNVQQWFTMETDPTEGKSEYIIRVNQQTLPNKIIWNLELLLNGEIKSQINGMRFPVNLSLLLSTWNKDNYIPPITDIFNVFQAKADVTKVKVPIEEAKSCLDGSGFYDGESGIKEIWLAVSDSLNDTENIRPYQLFKDICKPCKDGCNFGCDSHCSQIGDDFDVINLDVNGLKLTPTFVFQPENSTQNVNISDSSTFYLNVKMVNNAGVESVATSNGIMVDTTPPDCEYVQCTDPLHSLDEPTSFVGSNKTFGAFWSCDEDVSQIISFHVTVGTSVGADDVLGAVDVGLETKVALNLSSDVYFEHNEIYFVNIKATNEARKSVTRSCNMTVKLYPPEVTHIATKNMFVTTPPPGSAKVPVALTSANDRTGIRWNNERDDVEFYEWRIGSNPGENDILPRVKVGLSKAGEAAIVRGHLWLNNTNMNKSISEYVQRNWTNQNVDGVRKDSTFLLEPGRCLHHSLFAVGYSHLSSLVEIEPTCIKRTNDVLISSENRTEARVFMDTGGRFQDSGQVPTSSGQMSISLQTTGDSGGLIVGSLTSADMQHDYGTAASADFISYIVDPEATKGYTTRLLRNRLTSYKGISFFVAPTGSLKVSDLRKILQVNPSDFDAETEPVLAIWVDKEQQWYHVEEDCGVENIWDRGYTLTSHICLDTLTTDNARREKRAAATLVSTPHQFSIFQMNSSYSNHAPVITTNTIPMTEDKILKNYKIDWYDIENDCVEFALESGHVMCDVNITTDGYLTIATEKDFSGEIPIKVKVTEITCNSSSTIPNSKSAVKEIMLIVAEDNDEPDGIYLYNDTTWIDTSVNNSIDIVFDANSTSKHNLGYFIVGDVDTNETLSIITRMDNVSVAKISTSPLAPGLISFIHPNKYRTVKGISIDLDLPTSFHGHFKYSVLGLDHVNFTTSLLTLGIYSRWSPCVYGYCAERSVGIPCDDKSRAFSFANFRCECTPGYQGDWCETEIDECGTVPCPLMYDCHDGINEYTCTINPGKVMGIVCGIAVVIGMAIFLWRKLKRNKVDNFEEWSYSTSNLRSKDGVLKKVAKPEAKHLEIADDLKPGTVNKQDEHVEQYNEPEEEAEIVPDFLDMPVFAVKPGLIPRNVTGRNVTRFMTKPQESSVPPIETKMENVGVKTVDGKRNRSRPLSELTTINN